MPGSQPPAGKGLATQQRVLHCAVNRFADQGFRATSVAQIARDAGVTAPAVHGYFGAKEDLFRSAFEHDVTAVLAVIGARITDGTLVGSGPTLLPALITEVERHPLVRRILRGHEPDRTAELLQLPALAGIRADLVRAVAEAQAGNLLRNDLGHDVLAGAIETLILTFLLGATQIGMLGDDQRRAALAAIVAQGLRPADPPRVVAMDGD